MANRAMSDAMHAALLIDADNLSPDGMERGLAELGERGLNVIVRRAYGSHETLAVIKDFLQAHGVRAVVNQGKGTTDAALVVDAMDLLHGHRLPGVVAIGSGDGDFAPLVVRLREAGCRVLCLAQRRKSSDSLDRTYDEVIFIDGTARPKAATQPVIPIAPPVKKPARKAAPRKQAAAAKPAEPEPTVPQRVRRILEEFPGFLRGRPIELNAVVKRLKDDKLMAKNTNSRKFLAANAPGVEVDDHTVRLAG